MANPPKNKDNPSVILSTRVMRQTLACLKHEARKQKRPVSNIVATILNSALTPSEPDNDPLGSS